MRKFYFDMETVPDQTPGALDVFLAEVRPPAQYKKPESIDKWMAENAEAVAVENWKKSALDGIAGEICSIAFAIDDGQIYNLHRDINNMNTERDLLADFFQMLMTVAVKDGEGAFPRMQWVGHNIVDFDLRFLYHRCVVNNVRPSCRIPVNERSGGKYVYDTMKEWAGWKGFVKQDALVVALGIELPIVPDEIVEVDGSMVWDLYQAGRGEVIGQYNTLDVIKVREIHKRMTFS